MSKSGWIGVDLDGTVAIYGGWKGEEHIGDPIMPMIERIKRWRAEGVEVRIFTARVADEHAARIRGFIERWCLTHIGEVLPVTNIKDYEMDQFWDDRAIQVRANTGISIEDECAELRAKLEAAEKALAEIRASNDRDSIKPECIGCGLPYDEHCGWVDVVIPNEEWAKIRPDEGGLFCLTCLAIKLRAAGVTKSQVMITSGPFEITPERDRRLLESAAMQIAKLQQEVAAKDAEIARLESEVIRLRGWLTSIEGDTCPLGEDRGDAKVYRSAKEALAGKTDGALIRLMAAQRQNAAAPLEAEIISLKQRVAELEAIIEAKDRLHINPLDLIAQARWEGAATAASALEALLLEWQNNVEHWDSSEREFYLQLEQLAVKLREAADANQSPAAQTRCVWGSVEMGNKKQETGGAMRSAGLGRPG